MGLRRPVALETLRRDLSLAGCELVDRHQGGETIRRWNADPDLDPLLVVRCPTAEQVASALRLVRSAGRPVTIHNGGQDWTGRSLRNGCVVLDLSAMTSITIDPDRGEATIGGGVTAGSLNAEVARMGMAAVIGNDGAVGMAGLLMGGGYGPLMTRFGLACDSLVSAQVVLADGTIVDCDENAEQDLFWALRGGGGNFGVLTSARLRVHRLESAFVGNLVFPWRDVRAVLHAYADLMQRAPAELFGSAVLAVGPNGDPIVVLSTVSTGPEDQARSALAGLEAAGAPIVSTAARMDPGALLGLTDGKLAQGLGYDVGTRWFATLSPETIEALISGFEERTSAKTSIIVHHCHGAATEVEPDATAFGQRRPHFTALLYAAWEVPTPDAATHRDWTTKLLAALSGSALPGAYANLLPDKAAARIADAFGPNADRLVTLKRRFDPDGVFRAIPLPG